MLNDKTKVAGYDKPARKAEGHVDVRQWDMLLMSIPTGTGRS